MFDQFKPGANLMRIVIVDYATTDGEHQFNGGSLIEAYDSIKESLFGGLLEPNSPAQPIPVLFTRPVNKNLRFDAQNEVMSSPPRLKVASRMVSGLSFLPRLIRRGAVVMRNLPLVDE
jgi:hypothetical protein